MGKNTPKSYVMGLSSPPRTENVHSFKTFFLLMTSLIGMHNAYQILKLDPSRSGEEKIWKSEKLGAVACHKCQSMLITLNLFMSKCVSIRPKVVLHELWFQWRNLTLTFSNLTEYPAAVIPLGTWRNHIKIAITFSNTLSNHCTVAWVTRPEHPKGVKDEVKQARRAQSRPEWPQARSRAPEGP